MKNKTRWKPKEGEKCWIFGFYALEVWRDYYNPFYHNEQQAFKIKRQATGALRKIKKILRES